MAIDKLKNKFFAGSFITDVKHYFSKINEIIDWINNSVAAIGIGGSGTTNYISKFTASGTIGDSQIFDNGTGIGINNTLPTATIHTKGIDATSANYSIKITDSVPNNLLSIRNDGFVFVGSSAKDSYLWTQSAGGTLGLTNENGFASILANATKLFISNGGSGSNVFAQINTSNGNWLLGNPSTNVNTANLTDTKLFLQGVDATSSNYAFKINNSASTPLFYVRNDGVVIANNLPTSAAGLPAGAIWRNGNVLNIV